MSSEISHFSFFIYATVASQTSLRLNEQIAVEYTYEYMQDKKEHEKKNFHFLNQDIIEAYENSKNDSSLQASIIRESNNFEDREYDDYHKNSFDSKTREELITIYTNSLKEGEIPW